MGAGRDRLSRNIYVVSLVSFFQDTASEILYPVLPFFVTGTLGAPPAVLGLIEGLADGIASAMKAISGRLADLRHRRPLIATGYGVSASGKLLLALAGAWPVALAARVTDRVGKGLRGPPRDAIIADDTTPASRGRAFGFHRAADTAGAVVGPLIGLGVYELVGQQFRPLLWIALIPAIISVAARVPHSRTSPSQAAIRAGMVGARAAAAAIGASSASLPCSASSTFPTHSCSYARRISDWTSRAWRLPTCSTTLTYAVFSYPAGVVSDRLNRRYGLRRRPRRLLGDLPRLRVHDDDELGVAAASALRHLHRAHRRHQPGLGCRPRPRRRTRNRSRYPRRRKRRVPPRRRRLGRTRAGTEPVTSRSSCPAAPSLFLPSSSWRAHASSTRHPRKPQKAPVECGREDPTPKSLDECVQIPLPRTNAILSTRRQAPRRQRDK